MTTVVNEIPVPEEKVQPAETVKTGTKKKIGIIGCSDHKILAPWDDPTWEMWGVNNLFISLSPEQMKMVGKWFEIHLLERLPTGKIIRRKDRMFRGMKVEDYMNALSQLPVPVVMQKVWEEVPNSVEYPLKEVMEFFRTDYFTNTISWEIALAAYEISKGNYDKVIGIWGVDMATTTDLIGGNPEYAKQRPSCEFFLGMCLGMGISLEIPPESDLLKTRFLYGFQEPMRDKWQKKMMNTKKAINERMIKSMQMRDTNAKQVEQYQGALQAMLEMERIWE